MWDAPELQADRILGLLVAEKVDFVVVGGVAAILHGSARSTFDLDIAFATDAANLESLAAALSPLNVRLRGVDEPVPFVLDAATLRGVEVLTLRSDAGDLDLLARPAGVSRYAALRDRADDFEIEGSPARVASIEDLIAMKRASGRQKDLADVAELEAILRLRGR